MSKRSEEHILQGRTAGFVTRLLAYVTDVVVLAGIVAIGGWIAVLIDTVFEQMGLDLNIDIATIYVFLIPWIFGLYFVVFWSLTGRTIGKWFMGLKVISADGNPPTIGRSVIRFIGYGVSAIVFWLGYLWVLIDSDRQAWHDHMAKTWVVYDYERRKQGEVYNSFIERTDSR
jgi:uncharacterized RDD family membrane protein YckC